MRNPPGARGFDNEPFPATVPWATNGDVRSRVKPIRMLKNGTQPRLLEWQRSVHRGKLVYDLLTDCGRRTTKTVWPFRPLGSGPIGGDTLEEISLREHHYQFVFGRRMKAT